MGDIPKATKSDKQIIKHSHDSRGTVSYTGRLVGVHRDWMVIKATWVHGFYDVGCLTFQNGDVLTEYFSESRPYNAFRVDRSSGEFAGWYCNITAPLEVKGNQIHWHDLYLDVILLPDGTTLLLDEDELQESGIEDTDRQLYQYILNARDELLDRVQRRAYPFSTTDTTSQ